jgi:hypothetical protein
MEVALRLLARKPSLGGETPAFPFPHTFVHGFADFLLARHETYSTDANDGYLTMRRVFHWRNNTGAMRAPSGGFYRFGTPGSPDIIAVREGRAIYLEVKTEAGKLSPDQEAFRSGALEAGAQYEVVRSIDDVQALGL